MCLDTERINSLSDNHALKVNPEIFNYWNFKKNEELGLDIWKVKKTSKKDAWWVCKKCHIGYLSRICNRVKGTPCPYCTGKLVYIGNCLATTDPKLLNEWDYSANKITPYDVTRGSTTIKVWWKCKKCESSYERKVYDKVKGGGCTYCSGHKSNHTNSLASLMPELAKTWHPTKNGDLTPHDVTCGKGFKVWWLGECGHEWESVIADRVKGIGCPYCSKYKKTILVGFNDVNTTNPELANLMLNEDDRYKYSESSSTRVDWKCNNCENIIKDKRISNVKNFGLHCPKCSNGIKYPERFMREFLRNAGIDYEAQKTFYWSNTKRYDFYFELNSKSYIIETHGSQHYTGSFENVDGNSLEEEQENDRYKEKIAIENNIDNYIVIDCQKSNFNYIKNSVMNSMLSEVFDLNNIDWNDVMLSAEKSITSTTWDLYSNGVHYKDIVKKLNIKPSTVFKYIRRGKKLGIIN